MKAVLNCFIAIITFILLFNCDDSLSNVEYNKKAFDFSNAFEEWDSTVGTINSIRTGGDDVPYIDPNQTLEGDYSVSFGTDEDHGVSSFSAEVTLATESIISFSYRRSHSNPYINFRIDGRNIFSTTRAAPDWITVSYRVTSGDHTLEWEHDEYYFSREQAWIDNITAVAIADFSNAFEEWDQTIGTVNSIIRSGDKVPYIDSTEVVKGSYSVIFGEYESRGNSIFQADITLNQDCIIGFNYKRSNSGANLYFRADGNVLLNTTSTASEWATASYILSAGTHSLQWEHDKTGDGSERAWIDSISAAPVPEFSLAFEEWNSTVGTINSITKGGSNVPFVDPFQASDGLYSVNFGEYASTGMSWFQINTTFTQDCVISFKTTRTQYGGQLFFTIDGTVNLNTMLPSSTGWTQFSYIIAAGTHTFEWEHWKGDDGTQLLWIDGITITPAP